MNPSSRILVYGLGEKEIAKLRDYIKNRRPGWNIDLFTAKDTAHVVKMVERRRVDIVYYAPNQERARRETGSDVGAIAVAIRQTPNHIIRLVIAQTAKSLEGEFMRYGISPEIAKSVDDLCTEIVAHFAHTIDVGVH